MFHQHHYKLWNDRSIGSERILAAAKDVEITQADRLHPVDF